jgi:hypothetical protein
MISLAQKQTLGYLQVGAVREESAAALGRGDGGRHGRGRGGRHRRRKGGRREREEGGEDEGGTHGNDERGESVNWGYRWHATPF